MTAPQVTPPPYTSFRIDPGFPLMAMTWAQDDNATHVYLLTETGYYYYSAMTSTVAAKNPREGQLSDEVFRAIQDGLAELEQTASPLNLDLVGYKALNLQFISNKTPTLDLTCGNRDCPVTIREIVWYALIPIPSSGISPFEDEQWIQQLGQAFPDDLAWFLWYTELSQPPQVLTIGEDKLLETYLVVDGIFHYTNYMQWSIDEAEFRETEECLTVLKDAQQTDSGNDLTVIKMNDRPVGLELPIRFDRTAPPECLEKVISMAQDSLEREIPNATLQINPFGE